MPSNKRLTGTRRNFLSTVGGAGLASFAGCTGSPGGDTTSATPTDTQDLESVTAAWVYLSEVGDLGWTFAHDQGRKSVAEDLDFVSTEFSAAVAPSDARNVFGQYAQQDIDILFGTTFGYGDALLEMSQEYPDIAWEHCNGIEAGENMGIYYGKMYQARYLAGVAAGMVTDSNKLGFIGSVPISHTIREINGFAAGVKHVNPEAEILVRWVNAFFDPPKAKEATQALIDEGVDVTAQLTDSPATVRAASENGVWAVGSNSPMKQFGGDWYLTSGIWDWGVFYKDAVTSVAEGNWQPNFDWPGLDSGLVKLDEWGPEVPTDVKDEVSSRKQQIISGELNVFEGTEFEDKGSDYLYYDTGSFVDNIQGEVPG